MYAIKKILFLAVGAIILLHAVVHHEHTKPSNTLEIKSPEYCSSITESILNSFTLNQGGGHLEHFVNVEFDNPELLLSDILDIIFMDEHLPEYGSNHEEIYSTLNLPPDPLRGPPC